MMKILLFLILICPILCYSQTNLVSKWEVSKVCEHCNEPISFDIDVTGTGIIIAEQDNLIPVNSVTNTYWSSNLSEWKHLISTPQENPNFSGFTLQTKIFSSGYSTSILLTLTAYSHDSGRYWNFYSLPQGLGSYTSYINSRAVQFRFMETLGNNTFGRFLMSTDSGQSFVEYGVPISTKILSSFGDVLMTDSSTLWVRIYSIDTNYIKHAWLVLTTDAGHSWKEIYPIDTLSGGRTVLGKIIRGMEKSSIYLLNTEIHRFTDSAKKIDILYTTDYGNTWKADTSHKVKLIDLQNSGGTHLWGISTDRKVLAYSANNGITWEYDSLTFKDDSIFLMKWIDSTHGYILGYKDSTIKMYQYTPTTKSVESRSFYFINDIAQVHPSITTGKVTISSPHKQLNGSFAVSDILGRTISYENVFIEKGESKNISVSSLPTGMYFLIIKRGVEVVSFPIIKN